MWRRFLWVAIVAIAIVAGGIILFGGKAVELVYPDCAVDVRSRTPSPTGNKSLVIFGVDCGATTGFNTQASIAPSDQAFSRESYPAFLSIDGTHDIAVKWTGDRAVELRIPLGERIYRREEQSGEVSVSYTAE